ncbi:MAG TPA: cupin, partial [Rhodobacter sp.]|nr:cupin [Rhodobacter sp.]
DAFVIPPHMATCYSQTSPDLRILEVSLPGNFETTLLATAP